MVGKGALIFAVLVLVGCEAPSVAPKTPADHDRPVPAGVPRSELLLELDLEPASDCEERFDLALYQDRRVDLIAWDEGDGCMRRTVRIRYLSEKIGDGELMAAVKELAQQVRPADPERDTNGTASPGGEPQGDEETK